MSKRWPRGNATFVPAPLIDLQATLDGGQAFRWWADDGGYRGVFKRRILRLSRHEGGILLEVEGEDAPDRVVPSLRDYLGLDDDLEALHSRYSSDPALAAAMRGCPGLRLLRQDPWECLVGFVCSANSSVQKIKNDMTAISRAYGERIGPRDTDYAFPAPGKLAEAGEKALRTLRVGFRAKSLALAAEAVARGQPDPDALRGLPYEEAKVVLMEMHGVGAKIADCILGFSLGKGEAFPVDRWARRAVLEGYGLPAGSTNESIGRWARERFGRDAAYVNLYLFHHWRLRKPVANPHGNVQEEVTGIRDSQGTPV